MYIINNTEVNGFALMEPQEQQHQQHHQQQLQQLQHEQVEKEQYDDSVSLLWDAAEEAFQTNNIHLIHKTIMITFIFLFLTKLFGLFKNIVEGIKCLEAIVQSKTRALPHQEGETRLRLAEGLEI